jgi:hypothetical protein
MAPRARQPAREQSPARERVSVGLGECRADAVVPAWLVAPNMREDRGDRAIGGKLRPKLLGDFRLNH